MRRLYHSISTSLSLGYRSFSLLMDTWVGATAFGQYLTGAVAADESSLNFDREDDYPTREVGGSAVQRELHQYGSSRLGIHEVNRVLRAKTNELWNPWSNEWMDPVAGETETIVPNVYTFVISEKRYELTNHLGNVLATVTDRKTAIMNGGTLLHWQAEVLSTSDYYSFCMTMEGRQVESDKYRYGFNGKEKDLETGWQDYGFRIYHPALGKFLSVDPLTKDFPWWTPYQFAGNKPINSIDLDGLEDAPANGADNVDPVRNQSSQQAMQQHRNNLVQQTARTEGLTPGIQTAEQVQNPLNLPNQPTMYTGGGGSGDNENSYANIFRGGSSHSPELRNVTVTIGGEPLASVPHALIHDFPISPGDNLYSVPQYPLTVSGTTSSGSAYSLTVPALRWGVVRDEQSDGTLSYPRLDGAPVGTHPAFLYKHDGYFGSYAFTRIGAGHMMHVGVGNPAVKSQGNNGCWAINSGDRSGYNIDKVNNAILYLSGASSGYEVVQKQLLNFVAQPAVKPQLNVIKFER